MKTQTSDGRSFRRSSNEKLEQCKWPGCEREDKRHGYCATHSQRIRYSEDLEHLMPEHARAARCWVRDCDAPAYAKGLCRRHHVFVGRYSGEDLRRSLNQRAEQGRGRRERAEMPLCNAQRLRVLRAIKGATLEGVGAAIGVSRERIRQYSAGSSNRMPPERLAALAEYFGVPEGFLQNPAPIKTEDLL